MNRAIAVVTMAMLVGGAPAPVAGQAAGKADALPTGWSARPDGDKDLTNVKFVAMGQGYHVTLGPATVFYRKTDDGKGPFHLVAKFTQTKAPGHPEGYGLFYGGNDLAGAGQRYTYFLVRGDGQFLIKRRNGKETSVVAPWTAERSGDQSARDRYEAGSDEGHFLSEWTRGPLDTGHAG